jgi:hypothetical protein
MKTRLRILCKPLLNIFESGEGPYVYKSMNRNILLALGLMFTAMATAITYYIVTRVAYGYSLPAIIFFCTGFTCLIVGTLGNERAVAKIWGNK